MQCPAVSTSFGAISVPEQEPMLVPLTARMSTTTLEAWVVFFASVSCVASGALQAVAAASALPSPMSAR